jgi:hypothetical protein
LSADYEIAPHVYGTFPRNNDDRRRQQHSEITGLEQEPRGTGAEIREWTGALIGFVLVIVMWGFIIEFLTERGWDSKP